MGKTIWKKRLVVGVIAVFFSLAIMPTMGLHNSSIFMSGEKEGFALQDYMLPPPLTIDMPLEEAIFRRMSVREFTDEPVTDEELSTILWSACGYRDDGKRTIYDIGGNYAIEIYVLKEDTVYKYDALNHSLVFYMEGDYRDGVGWQYKAPIQLALVWNKTKSDENIGCAQIGAMYQNIQFSANAIDLGVVVTAEVPTSPIDRKMGVPSTEKGKIVMPLGHPEHPYNFDYKPQWISLLPRVEASDISLTTALEERNEGTSFAGELTEQEISQLIWSSYGFSYYLDKSGSSNTVKRHRTVPSGHGYYPFDIYAITESGIYRYYPNLLTSINWLLKSAPVDFFGIPIMTFMMKVANGDMRDEIAQASDLSVSSAPLTIVSVLDIDHTRPEWHDDFSDESIRWVWHFEAGSSAHNVLLETTACGLSANVFPVTDDESVLSILGLDDDFDPMFVVPVGK